MTGMTLIDDWAQLVRELQGLAVRAGWIGWTAGSGGWSWPVL